MGRLKSLTILLTLGAWATATDGAPMDDAPPASTPSARPQPPVNPSEYVKAAIKCAKSSDPKRAAKAADYARAAVIYRDMLTPDDQAKLDSLMAQLAPARAPAVAVAAPAPAQVDPAVIPAQVAAPAPVVDAPPNLSDPAPVPTDTAVRDRAVAMVAQARQALANNQVEEARALATEANALNAPFSANEDHPRSVLAAIEKHSSGGGLVTRGTAPTDAKFQARWLVQSAREQIALGHYDDAEEKIAQARALDVHWSLFDDTPAKAQETLEKARPKVANGTTPGVKGDRRLADAKLKQARGLIAAGQGQEAEALAMEVASWNLHWGLMGDNPNKVASAARALRRRDASRAAGTKGRPSEAMYDSLVASSRELMRNNRLDEAEAQARKAYSLGITPSLTADRAETVLNEINNTRQATAANAAMTAQAAPTLADPAVTAATTAQEPAPALSAAPEAPSVVTEREANALLASGNRPAAMAKFVEAQTLKTQEDAAQAAPTTPDLVPAPVEAAAPAPVAIDAPPSLGEAPATAPAAIPAGPGTMTLDQAKALLTSGNYADARKYAQQAKADGAGLEADQLMAQIAQTEQAAGLKIYESVLASIRKGTADDMGHARGLLSELQSMDLDESTRQRVEDLLMRVQAPAAPGHAQLGVSALDDKEAVEAQKLSVEVGTKVAEARRLMETDPDKAMALLSATIVQVKASGAKPSVTNTMVKRLEVNIELFKRDKVAFDQKMTEKSYRAEIENKRLRILEADKAKKDQMKTLMTKAEVAMSDGKFEEAEKFYGLASAIDPNEIAVIAGRTLAKARRYMARDKDIRSRKEEGWLEAMTDVDASGIANVTAQRNGIDFANFTELTARRNRTNDRLTVRKSNQILETEKILDRPITVNMDKTTLAEGIRYISELTGLNIMLDKKALAEEALTMNTPVSIQGTNMKLKTVLKYVLSDLSLTYHVDEEGVLVITSPQANNQRTYPVVYSVADLVVAVPHEIKTVGGLLDPTGDGQKAAYRNSLNAEAAAMTGGDNQFAAPTMGSGNVSGRDGLKSDRSIDMGPLMTLIRTSIAPGTWGEDHSGSDSMGGYGQGFADADTAVGSITPFYLNISLIIRHTAEVHDQVVDLLRQLRRLQDLQVSIEVRFITVSDSFYEQIGVDFDFSIQSDAVGRHSSFAIPNPAVALTTGTNTAGTTAGTTGGATAGGTAGGTGGTNPYLINPIRDHAFGGQQPLIVGALGANGNTNPGSFTQDLQLPFTQGSAGLITPFNAVSSANAAATFGIAFLSDLEVYLFLTAVQGDTRSNVVQAPKVTSFNGAPAAVQNGTQRYFVYSLQPVLAAGAIAYQPQIQGFNDGVFLTVTPVVSADRRYVRMTLSPVFNTLIQFENFTVPAAVGSLGGLGGQGTSVNATIQLPIFSNTTVQTTVTVPDGGTVLLGGVKRLREERNEYGVPILSKTPLIDRLFRNIGIGRTTDSLMLMVTPRIIILEEEEEKLGIPAVQNITF